MATSNHGEGATSLYGRIRLIQFKPAWSLHVLLRSSFLAYSSETVSSLNALGYTLPIIIFVDLKVILTEDLAIQCLQELVAERGEERQVDEKSSRLMHMYFRYRLGDIFDSLKQRLGYENRRSRRFLKWSFDRIPLAEQLVHLKNLLIKAVTLERSDSSGLTRLSDRNILEVADKEYTSLSSDVFTDQWGHKHIAVNGLLDTRSDALLFAHLAEALCFKDTANLLRADKHKPLIDFYHSMLLRFFLMSDESIASAQLAPLLHDNHWLRSCDCGPSSSSQTIAPICCYRGKLSAGILGVGSGSNPFLVNRPSMPTSWQHAYRIDYAYINQLGDIELFLKWISRTIKRSNMDTTNSKPVLDDGCDKHQSGSVTRDAIEKESDEKDSGCNDRIVSEVVLTIEGLAYLGLVAICFGSYAAITPR